MAYKCLLEFTFRLFIKNSEGVPDFTKGFKLLIAAILFLKDPSVIPGMSTGGASRSG